MLFHQMLQAAEEEGDIKAAKRARAEQAAEMAEFDDSYNLQTSSTIEVRPQVKTCQSVCVSVLRISHLVVMEW